MPKKTRHKKILAANRNKIKSQQRQSLPQTSYPVNTETRLKQTLNNSKPVEANFTTHYFRQDFTKSLFLIVGIITLELIFYFASMNTSIRSVLKFIP